MTQVYLCVKGAVERVKKIRDYAFVHFCQREDAINAMNALNGKVSNSHMKPHWFGLLFNDSHPLPCNHLTLL